MKKSLVCLLIAAALGFTASLQAADSKRTAEYLLTNPSSHEGTEVTIDVAFVKPVHWVSPLPEIAFFHALTIDRKDRKRGGSVLVAVSSASAEKFAKKYGMDFEGRSETDPLKGTFMAAGAPRRAHGAGRIWLIDTTGQFATLIAERKVQLPADGGDRAAGQRGPAGQP